MDHCELIRKIQADPFKKVEEHIGRPMKVRDMLELKEHVDSCKNCQDVIDGIHERFPEPPSFYKGEVN